MFAQPCATANGRSDGGLASMIGGHGEKQAQTCRKIVCVRTLIYLWLMGYPPTTVGVCTQSVALAFEIRGEAAARECARSNRYCGDEICMTRSQ